MWRVNGWFNDVKEVEMKDLIGLSGMQSVTERSWHSVSTSGEETLVTCSSEDIDIAFHVGPPKMFADPVERCDGTTMTSWTLVCDDGDAKTKMIEVRNIDGVIGV
jgi:hypothetical protein